MKKNALDSEQLKALFPETPPAFTAFVDKNLEKLIAGKETPVMKKKLSLGLALALILTALTAAAAVAAILSPTAEIFGFLYGKDKQEALLKGDIAALGSVHEAGDLEVTLEDVVYQTEGDMQGLYGTGLIAPREGSRVVLIPEDYSPNDAAGYILHYGRGEEVPEDAPSYAELAEKNGARMLVVRAMLETVSVDGKVLETEVGYSLIPQADGSVRFAFEMIYEQMRRADSYDLAMYLSSYEVDAQGAAGELQKERWTVHAVPALSETARAAIAAQTPAPEPTAAPTAAPGALKMAGVHWLQHEQYMAVFPDRSAADIRLEYGEWYPYIANPENEWDLGFFSLEDGSLEELIRAGRVLDLSGSQTIMAQVEKLYPKVQEALGLDGRIYAVPHVMFPAYNGLMAINPDKWQQLGWSFDKAPRTFAELCALAEEYMAIDRQTCRGTRFLGDGDTAAASRRLLLQELVNLAYGEAMAKGDASAIDTPAFREALTQIQAAYKALSKKQAAPDKNGMSYGLIWDGGQSNLDYRDDIRLRLRLGDAPVFPQRLGVCVINADSPRKEAAIQYMEWLAQNTAAQFLPELNAQVSAQEIAKRALEDDLLHYSLESRVRAGISEEDKAHIEKLKGMLAAGSYEAYYGPDEEILARYRKEVAPNLTIMTRKFPVTYDIQKDYLNGKLDADAFIKALAEAAK